MDVIVVDEDDDQFGALFESWAGERGVGVARWRLPAAARAISVLVDGEHREVTPARPMLLRPLRGVRPPATADDRFVWGELFASLWSAAALVDRPVVNRPDEWGWASRSTLSAVGTERRAGLGSDLPEALWHGAPPDGEFRYHQDLRTWATRAKPTDITFGRSRAMEPMRGWDQVVVVGASAFRVTAQDVHDEDIETRSVEVVAALGLTFATVGWGFPAQPEASPVMTRVNAFPSVYDCLPVLDDVFTALLRELRG